MTTVANHRTHLETITIIRCQAFVAFQPMEIFSFWRKEQFTFFPKMFTAPLLFLVTTPYPVKSSILHICPVLSWFYPHIQWSNLKKYEKIEGCEQSRVAMGARVARVVMWTARVTRVARNFHSSKYIVLPHSTFSSIYNWLHPLSVLCA